MVTRVTGLKSRAAGRAGTGEHTAYRLQPPYMMCLDISRYLHCRARYLDIYAGNMHWPGHLPYTWARKWFMCHGTVSMSTVCSNDTTWLKLCELVKFCRYLLFMSENSGFGEGDTITSQRLSKNSWVMMNGSGNLPVMYDNVIFGNIFQNMINNVGVMTS